MKASLCRWGRLPYLVNRILPSELEIPGNPTRATRKLMRHVSKGRAVITPGGRRIPISKHNPRSVGRRVATRKALERDDL